MVKYIFKLKKKYVPDLTQKEKTNYGGIRLIYNIYRANYFNVAITLLGRTFINKDFIWFKRKLGTKTFLRPYKQFWDKFTYHLPYVYWGKRTHPLTRHWVIISNSCDLHASKIDPEISLIHQKVKLFGYSFKSKDITLNLFATKNKFQL